MADDAAGVHVHRHEAALDLRHLPQRPALWRAVLVGKLGDHHHIADRHQIARHLRRLARLAIRQRLRAQVTSFAGIRSVPSSFRPSIPMRASLSPTSSTTAGIPARHIARHFLGIGQRGAPIGFRCQNFGRGHLAVPRQTPRPRSYFSSAVCKALAAIRLHVGIDGGADRQAAPEKLLLAEALRQLAADFVGEIVARRQAGLKEG
jgi:hypothetical protein